MSTEPTTPEPDEHGVPHVVPIEELTPAELAEFARLAQLGPNPR